MNNRIIRFRAWGECPTEMGYEMKMIYNPTINELVFNETIKINDLGMNFVLMQFTGLEDSKGTPIFEGDILLNTTHNEQKVEVYWRGCVKEDDSINGKEWIDWGGWKFRKLATEKEMTYAIDNDCIEVIGNVFQNPELVK